MKLGGDPALALALIVAVEASEVFADDPLVGPVRDAMAWADEVERWGLPRSRIRLFASPTPASRDELQRWCGGRGVALPPLPTQDALQRFIVDELPGLCAAGDEASLIIVWSGHGQINQRDSGRTRRLFYSDSAPSRAHNLELVRLMTALRSQRYQGFSRQLLIVDACANHAVGFSGGRRLLDPTDFSVHLADRPGQQWVLLAAAPGQIAEAAGANARETVSRYSQALLARLRQSPPGTWPDLRAAHAAVQAAFAAGDATPVDWCSARPDDVLPDGGVALLADAAATRLAAAMAGVADEVQRSAFHAVFDALPLTAAQRAAADDTALDGAAHRAQQLTELARLPGELPAPVRWALQVLARVDPGEHPELAVWLRQSAAPVDQVERYKAAIRRELAARSAASRLACLLLREMPQPDGSGELHGWLFAGDPPRPRDLCDSAAPLRVAADGSGRAAAIEALLNAAIGAAAEAGIDDPDLVIEVALPTAAIDADVDALRFGRGPASERCLGTRFPVVRRLADRIDALARPRGRSHQVLQWLKTAAPLRQRLAAHGLRIGWIAPAQIRAGLLPQHLERQPDAGCIGLQRVPPGRELDAETKELLFDDGLAFACWSADDWSDADTLRLVHDLGGCTGALALRELWALRSRAGFAGHPSARLQLLWDDPAHNPYELSLKAR